MFLATLTSPLITLENFRLVNVLVRNTKNASLFVVGRTSINLMAIHHAALAAKSSASKITFVAKFFAAVFASQCLGGDSFVPPKMSSCYEIMAFLRTAVATHSFF